MAIDEYAMLSEATYELKDNGEVKTQPKFLKLPANLRFTMQVCNKMFGSTIDLEVTSAPWANFKKMIAIRNRITHPKSVDDLKISDPEIEMCKRVVGWFNRTIANFVSSIADRDSDGNRPPDNA